MQQENKIIRTGPRPLWLHLSNALSIAAQQADKNFYPKYIEGVSKYFSSDMTAHHSKGREILWQKDDVKALGSVAQKTGQPYVLLIPSLINGSEILDLTPEYSFFSYLENEGYSPVLIDWGTPFEGDKKNLDGYILSYLKPLIKELAKDQRPLICIGYCMGGLLLLGAMQSLSLDNVACIYMATPWDFSKAEASVIDTARYFWMTSQMDNAGDVVSVDMLQSFFATIDRNNTAQKFVDFAKQKDIFRNKLFVAVEDWLNHGRPLSREIFNCCMKDWYMENKTACGQWYVNGAVIDPSENLQKSLIVVAKKDRLVPSKSALALQALLKDCEAIQPELGHIGLMGSCTAQQKVWLPVSQWINKTLNSGALSYKSVA